MKFLGSQIDFVTNYEKDFLESNCNETVIVTLNETEAVYGKDNSCNIEYCNSNNVKYVHQGILQGGGCIIGVKGNIFIDAKRPSGGKAISNKFSEILKEYFISKGLNSVRCNNNDILIDNYKVASGCQSEVNGYQYMGYQISINQDH